MSTSNKGDWIDGNISESAEKTTGLRKRLEAKDCFVRAKIGDNQRIKVETKAFDNLPNFGAYVVVD